MIAHHPPFTAVTRRQGESPHITALVPMFEKYHAVDGTKLDQIDIRSGAH